MKSAPSPPRVARMADSRPRTIRCRRPGAALTSIPATSSCVFLTRERRNSASENPYFRPHEGVAGATTVIGGRAFDNYSSYNYLGLVGHPDVSAAAKAAIDRYGTSASASRLVSGERPIHAELERELAALHGVDDCVVFVSGHATNVSTIGQLFGAKDLGSARCAGPQQRAAWVPSCRARAACRSPTTTGRRSTGCSRQCRLQYERVLIVGRGHLQHGRGLPRPAAVRRDQAPPSGASSWSTRRIRSASWAAADSASRSISVSPVANVDIWMGTLSKALASCGGYIAGERALVEHLKCAAPGFVYSVGMPPPLAAAALAALRILRAEPQRAQMLRERGRKFLELRARATASTPA